jgi:hypothetical protein
MSSEIYTHIWYLSGAINGQYKVTDIENNVNKFRKKFAGTIGLRKAVFITEAIYRADESIIGECDFKSPREFRDYADSIPT